MSVAPLECEDIERRAPLWMVLSDLFLDTEPTRELYLHIARVILDGGYSAAEAEQILREDVAPGFWTNLLPPAGEWAGWDDDFIREQVLNHRTRLRSRIGAWLFCRKMIDEAWQGISSAMQESHPTSAVRT